MKVQRRRGGAGGRIGRMMRRHVERRRLIAGNTSSMTVSSASALRAPYPAVVTVPRSLRHRGTRVRRGLSCRRPRGLRGGSAGYRLDRRLIHGLDTGVSNRVELRLIDRAEQADALARQMSGSLLPVCAPARRVTPRSIPAPQEVSLMSLLLHAGPCAECARR